MKTLDRNNVSRMINGSISKWLYICQQHVNATGDIAPHEQMRLDELQKELVDLICRVVEAARIPDPEDDESVVRKYIFSDTHHEEDFSDIEICCEADFDDAAARIDEYLDAFSPEEMKALADLIRSGAEFDLIEGGWSVGGKFYPKRKPSAAASGFGVYTDTLEWTMDADLRLLAVSSDAIRADFASRFEGQFYTPEDVRQYFACYRSEVTGNAGFVGAITDSINDRIFDGVKVFTTTGNCIFVTPYIPFDEDDKGFSPTQKRIQEILRSFLGPLTESPVEAQWIG